MYCPLFSNYPVISLSLYVAKGALISVTLASRLHETGLSPMNCVYNQINKCKFNAESGIVYSLKGLIMNEHFKDNI